MDKDKESLRNEVTKVKKQIVSGEHIAQHQRSELKKLTRIIQEADEERQRQVRCGAVCRAIGGMHGKDTDALRARKIPLSGINSERLN